MTGFMEKAEVLNASVFIVKTCLQESEVSEMCGNV